MVHHTSTETASMENGRLALLDTRGTPTRVYWYPEAPASCVSTLRVTPEMPAVDAQPAAAAAAADGLHESPMHEAPVITA